MLHDHRPGVPSGSVARDGGGDGPPREQAGLRPLGSPGERLWALLPADQTPRHTTARSADGQLVQAYSTAGEPDGVAYIRCGNRRAAVCPSCSHEYQGDMWHLQYAGAAGGIKDVPEQVAEHPLTFLTLTAPSFGSVHTIRAPGKPCRPGKRLTLCTQAGRNNAGTFTPTVTRSSARLFVPTATTTAARWHSTGTPPSGYPAPTAPVTVDQLGDAIQSSAAAVSLVTDPYAFDGPIWRLHFGEQMDIRHVHGDANREASVGPMHPEMVAAYIAKYATKAADDFGLTPRRIPPDVDLAALPVSDHVRRLLATAIKIGSAASTTVQLLSDDNTTNIAAIAAAETWLPIIRWLHMLGFRGHFNTKSRRYSTILGRLRAERRNWRRRHEVNRWPADLDDDRDESTLVIVRDWAFHGIGWLTAGDAALAASAAARAREHREYARDAKDADQDHD